MLIASEECVKGEEGRERRRGLRIAQARPVKIYEPSLSRYYGGKTEDISTTGLRIELPVSALIRPGKVLNVHVGVNESGQPLANRRGMLPARVVWIDRSSQWNKGRLVAGIEFVASIASQVDAA